MPVPHTLTNFAAPLIPFGYAARDAWGACQGLPWKVVGMTGVALSRLCGPRAGAGVGILTYHRVSPCITGLPKPLHNVTPTRFRRQIKGLLSRGFSFWPLGKLLEAAAHGTPIPARTALITIDDGYENVYSNAWPVLRELNVPATVFVATAYLGRHEPFPFDGWGIQHQGRAPAESFRPLTISQCREMQADGLVEIGAHTHTHRDFRERPDEFVRDLQISVDIVRNEFSLREVTFAFPYGCPYRGFAGSHLVAAAKKTGVVCGLTTEAETVDPASDPFRWGRFNVFPWDSAATLAAKLEGWYGWAPNCAGESLRSLVDKVPVSDQSRWLEVNEMEL